MNTQSEGKYRAAKERVAHAPDDLAALREFSLAARDFDKRDEAVTALKAAYQRRPTPELYADLRQIRTYPEFQAIAPPASHGKEATTQAATGAEILPRKAFPMLLDQVIFYPVQDGLSVFILITSAISMTIGSMFAGAMGGIGIAAALVFMGIVFGYLWSVMHASGMGEKRTRGWPDFANPEDFGAAVGQYYMVFAICFGPAIVLLLMQPFEERMLTLLGSIFLAGIGVLYYPMALMMAGFTHSSWEALNLPSGLKSIFKMPMDYLICLAFIAFSFVVVTVAQVVIHVTFGGSPLVVQVGVSLFAQVASVYLLIIQMRAVGLLYFAREKDLGWFQ